MKRKPPLTLVNLTSHMAARSCVEHLTGTDAQARNLLVMDLDPNTWQASHLLGLQHRLLQDPSIALASALAFKLGRSSP